MAKSDRQQPKPLTLIGPFNINRHRPLRMKFTQTAINIEEVKERENAMKFTYLVEPFMWEGHFNTAPEQLTRYLNRRGSEGWELVSVQAWDLATRLFTFKKPVPR